MSHTLTWVHGGWNGGSFWRAWFPARTQALWIARMLTRPCRCGAETGNNGLSVLHEVRCRKGAYRSFKPDPSRFVIHVDRAAFEIVANDGHGGVKVAPCAPEGLPF